MSEIRNIILLAGDIFIREMYLNIVLVDHLQKTMKEYKNLNKPEIRDKI